MKIDMHEGDRRPDTDMACLSPLNEGDLIVGQMLCENAMQTLLDELCLLVAVSDMSQARRQYFVDGIAHLRGHVASELFGLLYPRASRAN